ncbi:MAG: UDP-glucose 4-epimerase GalE [FCB group bacterium]|nr:UDP-glucose 4-epimerase GalE [FCB group bacterium]
MKVLVTGGAGYIGSHAVTDLCDGGHEVTIFDDLSLGLPENVDERATFVQGSTLNLDDLENIFRTPFDAVMHFAAWKAAGESMIKPEKYSRNNLVGTINLLNAMVGHGVKMFVFSSSAAVYGYPKYLPIDENHPLDPINYYGFTKLEIERILKWYSALKDVRFAALRYFNAAGYDVRGRIRGKEKNPANLLPIVMEVAAGSRERLEVYGDDYDTRDGTGVRDYIHVNDLASAHVLALDYLSEKNKDLTVNLATGIGFSVLEVIAKAREVTGKEIPYKIVDRRPGDPAELVATSNIAQKLLGWEVKHSDLETILSSMWSVYRSPN